jgi:D-alanyl-D-alanine dipeptidase
MPVHFKTQELVDRKTYERMGEDAIALFKPHALIALDDLWEFFNAKEPHSIIINNWLFGGTMEWRGYRTPEKAKELGSPNSRHSKGDAFDCTIKNLSAEDARQCILADQDNHLLKYITRLEGGVSWLHWDCAELSVGKNRIYVFKP